EERNEAELRRKETSEKFRQQLRGGSLDHRTVEMEIKERNYSSFSNFSNAGIEDVDINLKEMLPGLFSGKTKKRKLRIDEAKGVLLQEEKEKLIDMDQIAK